MKNGLIIAVFVIGGIYLLSQQKTASQKRAELLSVDPAFARVINLFSEQELNDVYTFVFDYVRKGKYPQMGTPLYYSIQAIGQKYNIFT